MKPKTEEFLYLLLWSMDHLCRPTFRNLTDSFESWAYQKGFARQLVRLERLRLIESKNSPGDDRIVRLTTSGRLHALGGRDPETYWSREWDGVWRLVVFDVSRDRNTERDRLRRYLVERGFGYLQDSVWIAPDPLNEEREILAGSRTNVESLLLLDARPCAGESNDEIVSGAWDFDAINQAYRRYLTTIAELPDTPVEDERSAKTLMEWLLAERRAWFAALAADPLLPAILLPKNYLGRHAWEHKLAMMRVIADRLRKFSIKPNFVVCA